MENFDATKRSAEVVSKHYSVQPPTSLFSQEPCIRRLHCEGKKITNVRSLLYQNLYIDAASLPCFGEVNTVVSQ